MIARLFTAIGAILVVVGVLKFVRIFTFNGATAGGCIVLGIILVIVGEYVLAGGFGGRSGYRRVP